MTSPSALTAQLCPACGAPVDGGRGAVVDHLGYALLSCGSCGAWFCDPQRPAGAAAAADYDAIYETPEYEQVQVASLRAMTDFREMVEHPTYNAFFSRVRPGARGGGRALLDVGCGEGRILRAARSVGWDVRGIDVSARAIEIGRAGAEFPMSTESLDDLRAAGARFDAVTAFEVLEHLAQPRSLVRSAAGVLKENGRFFCTVPNRESPTVRTTVRPDWLPPVHLTYFTRTALQRALELAGLTDVQTGYVWGDGWPPLGRRTLRYAARRILGRARPDPLGLWGTGRPAGDGRTRANEGSRGPQ